MYCKFLIYTHPVNKTFNILTLHRGLTEFPHLAGTDADYQQARELHDFWKSVGLDEAFITPYDVLLSYPNTTDPSVMNRIFVYDNNDAIQWESELYEPILHPSENKSGVVPPFNAYSAPGNVTSVSPKICFMYLKISWFFHLYTYI